jgi:tetratricopeptide (TPR) repeat protein
MIRRLLGVLLSVFLSAFSLVAQPAADSQETPVELLRAVMAGGPYERPWLIEGAGSTHFPISCKAETQVWFDQGNTLLQSFWYYEARRSFRWVLKLDPQCAIAYWALAEVQGVPPDLRRRLIEEASKRKGNASARERLIIEAAEASLGLDSATETSPQERFARFRTKMEQLASDFPDDVEVKILYSHLAGREKGEELLQQVLKAEPNHPGAHHFRIHSQEHEHADRVLDSAAALGNIVSSVGHTIHMSGHVSSALGRWHEAARAMDIANRVELAYIAERRRMPFNTWNYGHNRNYLSYIEERLGMVDKAIEGAREMLRQPLNPESTDPRRWRPRLVGKTALLRALATFERWEEILRPGAIPWTSDLFDRVARHYAEALAHIGLGAIEEARKSYASLTSLKDEVGQSDFRAQREYPIHVAEIEALLELAAGSKSKGIELLTRAAEQEAALRHGMNDPPLYPRFLYQVLGDAHLKQGNPGLAAGAFTKALGHVANDGKSLAGLILAEAELGNTEEAQEAYSRFLWVFASADRNLPEWREVEEAARKLQLRRVGEPEPQAIDYIYPQGDRSRHGPAAWRPPALDATEASPSACPDLAAHRGRNVLLAFVSGSDCPQCDEQLAGLVRRKADFSAQRADLLVVAGDGYATQTLPTCADASFAAHRRLGAWDDFENTPLKATAIVDVTGALFWVRYGHDAFLDTDFLVNELRHLNTVSGG